MLSTPIKRLRVLGLLEGISFILLLGLAMPLKYFMDIPQFVTVIGMAHGVLFMLYLLAVGLVAIKYRWPFLHIFGAVIAAITPFGPFIFDHRILKQYETKDLSSAKPL